MGSSLNQRHKGGNLEDTETHSELEEANKIWREGKLMVYPFEPLAIPDPEAAATLLASIRDAVTGFGEAKVRSVLRNCLGNTIAAE